MPFRRRLIRAIAVALIATLLSMSPLMVQASVPAKSAADPSSIENLSKKDIATYQALFSALERGDASRLNTILNHGVSANIRFPEGLTLLMIATSRSRPAVVKVLLEHGANVNAAEPRSDEYTGGSTALIVAMNSGMFLGGFPPPAPQGYGGHEAEFMRQYPEKIQAWNRKTEAWKEGFDQIARLLIAHGAQVNCQTVDGETAVGEAAAGDRLNMVELLLAKGARLDLPIPRRDGEPSGSKPLQSSVGSDALVAATSDPSMVALLLAHGVNPSTPSPDGLLPLATACDQGNVEAVRMLLHAGADVNAYDSNGSTALMFAQVHHNSEIVALLQQAGAENLPRRL